MVLSHYSYGSVIIILPCISYTRFFFFFLLLLFLSIILSVSTGFVLGVLVWGCPWHPAVLIIYWFIHLFIWPQRKIRTCRLFYQSNVLCVMICLFIKSRVAACSHCFLFVCLFSWRKVAGWKIHHREKNRSLIYPFLLWFLLHIPTPLPCR